MLDGCTSICVKQEIISRQVIDSVRGHFAFKYCHRVKNMELKNMELKNVDNGEHKCLISNV